jgi:hypothetical protein
MTRLQWLVNASQFPGRYTVLATSLGPHLSHICTNENARSLVLHITHQGYDREAVRIMVDELHQAAPNIIDQVDGMDFMLKVLDSPNIDPAQKRALDERIEASEEASILQQVVAEISILTSRRQARDNALEELQRLAQTQTHDQQQLPPDVTSEKVYEDAGEGRVECVGKAWCGGSVSESQGEGSFLTDRRYAMRGLSRRSPSE